MKFLALNGGPKFKFNEAISIVIYCHTQAEIDHYWTKLTENGEEGPCGWLKDKYGVSWQITPAILPKYLTDPNAERRNSVEKCAFQMKKFDIEKLQKAYDGEKRIVERHRQRHALIYYQPPGKSFKGSNQPATTTPFRLL